MIQDLQIHALLGQGTQAVKISCLTLASRAILPLLLAQQETVFTWILCHIWQLLVDVLNTLGHLQMILIFRQLN